MSKILIITVDGLLILIFSTSENKKLKERPLNFIEYSVLGFLAPAFKLLLAKYIGYSLNYLITVSQNQLAEKELCWKAFTILKHFLFSKVY